MELQHLKRILAPAISNEEFALRHNALHRSVFAAPPFDFDAVTAQMYKAPEGYYTADHCLVHDGGNWHLFYVTGEIKNFEIWAKAYKNQDVETYKKFQYEIGDGHASGKTLEDLKFNNIVLTTPQGNFDTSTRGNLHIVRPERKRVSGSGCVIDTATAQASAPLLWGTGTELAVAGSGDGAGWAEAGCGA